MVGGKGFAEGNWCLKVVDRGDITVVDAEGAKRRVHVLTERVSPGACDDRSSLAEARRCDGDICRATAKELFEVLNLDNASVAGGVEVNTHAADS